MNYKLIPYFIICIIFLTACVSGGTVNDTGYWRPIYLAPIGLGNIIAVVVSWSRNKSILLAIIHGILGWLYVIYALLVKK